MRVFVAGATGTIGASLVEKLHTSGHEVIGLRHRDTGQAGVGWVTADVLDRDGLLRAVSGVRADAVISELSALKKLPAWHRDMAATNTLRTRGTANLLEVARQIGAHRFVTQSMMFGYGYDDQGPRLRRESEPFAPEGQSPWEPHLAAMRENERLVLTDPSIEGVALRYALFYGAGASQPLIDRVVHRQLPVLADCPGSTSTTPRRRPSQPSSEAKPGRRTTSPTTNRRAGLTSSATSPGRSTPQLRAGCRPGWSRCLFRTPTPCCRVACASPTTRPSRNSSGTWRHRLTGSASTDCPMKQQTRVQRSGMTRSGDHVLAQGSMSR
jgi:hypothetical protein